MATSSNASRQTLEQQRAQDAWNCTSAALLSGATDAKKFEKYEKAAKGLPALIMNSGLMQVLAFCHAKGEAQADVTSHLRTWLAGRFQDTFKSHDRRDGAPDFGAFMKALMKAEPATYQAINAEAFAWLKWLRQMASARKKEA